jgi:hypothetical protein
LLIQAHNLDYHCLILGALFALLLKQTALNPMLVLSGLIMPWNITYGLAIGGLCSYYSKHKEEWYPFWSGIFTSSSLYMIIKSILN